jgi:hypothetical protein
MAELTQSELETKIAAIDAQITTLIASPATIADYRIGQKSVSKSQVMINLLEARKAYQEQLNAIPAEDFNRFAVEVSEIGEDLTEYLGDEGQE